MREYNGGDFKHPGKILHTKKKHKKSIYDANNARNRDSYSVTKSNGMLKEEKEIKNSYKLTNINEVEDTLIRVLDFINEENK